MSRTISVNIPPEMTDEVIKRIKEHKNYLELKLQRGISVDPPGDIITIETTNIGMPRIIRLLISLGIPGQENTSISTSEPTSMVSKSSYGKAVTDRSDVTWEEMEFLIGKESNMTVNSLLLMFLAGLISAFGISTNALHILIGAMLIAPGFEPLTRISLGLVAKGSAFKRGMIHTVIGYAALFTGAVCAALILSLLGEEIIYAETSFFPEGVFVPYWTSIKSTSLIISTAAGLTGALLIVCDRSVLTGGVMIALALIPSMSIAGMATVNGDANTMAAAFMRWSVEALIVIVCSALIFFWKRMTMIKRDFMLKA